MWVFFSLLWYVTSVRCVCVFHNNNIIMMLMTYKQTTKCHHLVDNNRHHHHHGYNPFFCVEYVKCELKEKKSWTWNLHSFFGQFGFVTKFSNVKKSSSSWWKKLFAFFIFNYRICFFLFVNRKQKFKNILCPVWFFFVLSWFFNIYNTWMISDSGHHHHHHHHDSTSFNQSIEIWLIKNQTKNFFFLV